MVAPWTKDSTFSSFLTPRSNTLERCRCLGCVSAHSKPTACRPKHLGAKKYIYAQEQIDRASALHTETRCDTMSCDAVRRGAIRSSQAGQEKDKSKPPSILSVKPGSQKKKKKKLTFHRASSNPTGNSAARRPASSPTLPPTILAPAVHPRRRCEHPCRCPRRGC